MDETPKKVIRSEFYCFLCSCNLGKDQVRVFRKSAVDIARFIKRALDVDVSLYSPWGRNECVTNEPQRTSAGRLVLHLVVSTKISG